MNVKVVGTYNHFRSVTAILRNLTGLYKTVPIPRMITLR